MKSFLFIAFWLAATATNAYPNQGPAEQQPQGQEMCTLASIISSSGLELPELDVGFDDGDLGVIADPLTIRNFSITIDGRVLNGTYSFTNGIVEGLSGLNHDFGYTPDTQRFYANATLKLARLTGEYEIVDGKTNLPGLGQHSVVGKGPLTASVSDITASFSVKIINDPVTSFLSTADLDIDFNFANASVVAENLVVDGVPVVQWEEVNQSIRPLYETFWVNAQNDTIPLIQENINRLLEGCTLMDLIQLIPRPAQP